MTISEKIKGEKLQNNINRAAAKIFALSSGKIDKYDYLAGEDTLSPQQHRIIEKSKFTYVSVRKVFEKKNYKGEDEKASQLE